MKLFVTRINEKKVVVVGRVKEVKQGTNVVNIKLEGTEWDKEEKVEKTKVLDIAFWNNDVAPLADRVIAAKVSENSVIAVEVYENESGKYSANRFMYRGHWMYAETEDRKEKNVFMGVVASLKSFETATGKKLTKVSIPVSLDEEETEWNHITFWNNDSSPLADRAAKVLAGREEKKAKAIIVCGPGTDYEGNMQYTGYSFERIE